MPPTVFQTFNIRGSDENDFAVEFARKDTSGEILAVTELDEVSSYLDCNQFARVQWRNSGFFASHKDLNANFFLAHNFRMARFGSLMVVVDQVAEIVQLVHI